MLFVAVHKIHLGHAGGAVYPLEHPQRDTPLGQPLHQRVGENIVAKHGHLGYIAAQGFIVQCKVDAVAGQIITVHFIVDIDAVVCHGDGSFHAVHSFQSPIT